MKIRQQRTIEKNICKKMILLSFCMILMVSMAGCGNKRKENLTITNVSYDPTREFYEKYNKDFIKYYKDKWKESRSDPVPRWFWKSGKISSRRK